MARALTRQGVWGCQINDLSPVLDTVPVGLMAVCLFALAAPSHRQLLSPASALTLASLCRDTELFARTLCDSHTLPLFFPPVQHPLFSSPLPSMSTPLFLKRPLLVPLPPVGTRRWSVGSTWESWWGWFWWSWWMKTCCVTVKPPSCWRHAAASRRVTSPR